MSNPIELFIERFNKRDEAGVKGLLADDATAEVIGSGFGTEKGPADIGAKSIAHMIALVPNPLLARPYDSLGEPWVVFVTDDPTPRLDTAARMETRGLAISRIEYHVVAYSRSRLAEIADELGMEVAG